MRTGSWGKSSGVYLTDLGLKSLFVGVVLRQIYSLVVAEMNHGGLEIFGWRGFLTK